MLMRCGRQGRTIADLTRSPLGSRVLSTSARLWEQQTRVDVPCNSKGSVHLDIYHPTRAPVASRTACLYLPRGPILNDPEHDALNIAVLRNTLACPVVQINYRHGIEHQHPQPVHDVAAAYDWVVHNLCDLTAHRRFSREPIGKLVVCGELLGGSLATTLALTECRANEPAAVVAAAVNNAVINWVDLHEEGTNVKSLRGTNETSQSTMQELSRHREKLFRKPEDYFDPFASPALFFRAAGSKVPRPEAPLSEMEELALVERQDFLQLQQALGSTPIPLTSTRAEPPGRKSSRRFPSRSLALRLPQFRISSGGGSVLAAQADELSRLLHQALERQSKLKPPRAQSMVSRTTPSLDEMIMHYEVDGVGLWDESVSGRSSMRDTAVWLANALQD